MYVIISYSNYILKHDFFKIDQRYLCHNKYQLVKYVNANRSNINIIIEVLLIFKWIDK